MVRRVNRAARGKSARPARRSRLRAAAAKSRTHDLFCSIRLPASKRRAQQQNCNSYSPKRVKVALRVPSLLARPAGRTSESSEAAKLCKDVGGLRPSAGEPRARTACACAGVRDCGTAQACASGQAQGQLPGWHVIDIPGAAAGALQRGPSQRGQNVGQLLQEPWQASFFTSAPFTH